MDDENTRALWDLKYERGLPSLTKPDPFFVSAYGRFVAQSFPRPGTALDLATGLGRHSLWLAEKKWNVSAVDISEVAIGKLAQAAAKQNLYLNLLATDLGEYSFEPARFDLIILFYHLDRRLFPKIESALTSGGMLISKMRIQWDPGKSTLEPNPVGRNEYPSLVPALRVQHHVERETEGQGVVEFIGRKNGPSPGNREWNDNKIRY